LGLGSGSGFGFGLCFGTATAWKFVCAVANEAVECRYRSYI